MLAAWGRGCGLVFGGGAAWCFLIAAVAIRKKGVFTDGSKFQPEAIRKMGVFTDGSSCRPEGTKLRIRELVFD